MRYGLPGKARRGAPGGARLLTTVSLFHEFRDGTLDLWVVTFSDALGIVHDFAVKFDLSLFHLETFLNHPANICNPTQQGGLLQTNTPARLARSPTRIPFNPPALYMLHTHT